MKVLFAVHDEKVSSSIVKKYQKDYKEIISYKNVYYFNAILKELQRDKSYDRIVIDEELEEFTSTSFEQKDKFIFDKLDNITDEASSTNGKDIPIILICSERRAKAEDFLVKIFGIGIYNAIMGNDRSTDEVCRLINKPRSKKEAKTYYRIDVDDVSYKPENEDDVSEEEMQHILSYFKKLGKNEAKYVECFRNIVSQYNDNQMKIIIAILPLHVRSILEESSPEYQKIIAKNGGNYVVNRPTSSAKTKDPSGKLLEKEQNKVMSKPIVVPSKIENTVIKKISLKKPTVMPEIYEDSDDEEEIEEIQETPVTKKRGRPRKNPETVSEGEKTETKPKRRGRPRKNPLPEEIEEKEDDLDEVLSEIDSRNAKLKQFEEAPIDDEEDEDTQILSGFDEDEDEEEDFLPGIDEEENNDDDDTVLPGFDDENDEEEYSNDDEYEETSTDFDEEDDESTISRFDSPKVSKELEEYEQPYEYDYSNYNNLLTGEKKVIAFIGTSKNGTSFIINNVAKILSDSGIDTAILDTTKNKNAFYIYTKNEEELRQAAANSINNLMRGPSGGVSVSNNLTVYAEVPGQESNIKNVGPILETLAQNYTAVLIDCDYDTPLDYFANAQEIYLIQSMDVLTIQPLTAFLRELKTKGILNESKLKIILNKFVKIKGVTGKNIVGGMAYYNDPEMSFMTELFDKNSKVPIEIPFNEQVYAKYLEEIVECEISVDKYPKDFQAILKDLACVIYPLLPGKQTKQKAQKGYQYSNGYENNKNEYANNGFSNSVNNTLNNMKKKY